MDTKNTTKKLPNSFGDTVMEFAKISSDAYHNGVLQGEIKALEEARTEIQRKLNDAQARYDKTQVGAILKKARDG
tara:strand:- start:25 stop:249 length:225 start_codon:yes stop_codon:yes gene_type:complete